MAWKNYWRHYSGPDYKFYIFALAILILAVAVAYSGFKPQVQLFQNQSSQDSACTNSGGTVSYSQCCTSANDFPNNCLIGACGCSPSNSHQVKTCQCPQGSCWDGSKCVSALASTTQPPTGNLAIALKDGGIKLPGLGTATSLLLTLSSVDISYGPINDTSSSWTNVYSGSKSVDIVNYQNSSAVIAQKDLSPSSYHKVRLHFNDSEIKIYYYSVGLYNKTYPLLAIQDIVLPVDFSITQNQKTVLYFDIDISNSVVKEPDANGVFAYKFKPQINISQATLGISDPIPNSDSI